MNTSVSVTYASIVVHCVTLAVHKEFACSSQSRILSSLFPYLFLFYILRRSYGQTAALFQRIKNIENIYYSATSIFATPSRTAQTFKINSQQPQYQIYQHRRLHLPATATMSSIRRVLDNLIEDINDTIQTSTRIIHKRGVLSPTALPSLVQSMQEILNHLHDARASISSSSSTPYKFGDQETASDLHRIAHKFKRDVREPVDDFKSRIASFPANSVERDLDALGDDIRRIVRVIQDRERRSSSPLRHAAWPSISTPWSPITTYPFTSRRRSRSRSRSRSRHHSSSRNRHESAQYLRDSWEEKMINGQLVYVNAYDPSNQRSTRPNGFVKPLNGIGGVGLPLGMGMVPPVHPWAPLPLHLQLQMQGAAAWRGPVQVPWSGMGGPGYGTWGSGGWGRRRRSNSNGT